MGKDGVKKERKALKQGQNVKFNVSCRRNEDEKKDSLAIFIS